MNPFAKSQNHLLTNFFGQNKVYTIMGMKTYNIRIITSQSMIIETVRAAELNVSTSGRYYYFITEDKKMMYYPVNNTIINEI